MYPERKKRKNTPLTDNRCNFALSNKTRQQSIKNLKKYKIMKFTMIFLFVAMVIAVCAIVEKMKAFFESDELLDAYKNQHLSYVWTDISYGSIR
jgi:hypothetical protein